MNIEETNIAGLRVLTPKVNRDARGYFLETWREDTFEAEGFPHFVQDNHAFSLQAGVVRGLHFQRNPMSQSKLVWVSRGSVLDVAVDLRKGSETFGKHFTVVLDSNNFKRLFIPQGFAHGYLTLEEQTDFHYKVDNFYSAKDEGGILWNSPSLEIDWGSYFKGDLLLSEKDLKLPDFIDFVTTFTM